MKLVECHRHNYIDNDLTLHEDSNVNLKAIYGNENDFIAKSSDIPKMDSPKVEPSSPAAKEVTDSDIDGGTRVSRPWLGYLYKMICS